MSYPISRFRVFSATGLLLCGLCLLSNTESVSAVDSEIVVPELTDAQKTAIEGIREGSVLSAVAFLASDEMAGRATPSRELTIASAYVAARFRGAGLTSIQDNGSFYQTHQIEMEGPGRPLPKVSVNNTPDDRLRILWGRPEELEIAGSLTTKVADSGAVQVIVIEDIMLAPQMLSSPARVMSVWSRRIRPFTEAGASLVIIRSADDSPLWQIADQMRSDPVNLPEQYHPAVPVLIAPLDFPVEGNLTAKVPANTRTTAPVHNVIGVLSGSDPELRQEAVIISAHLDHIGTLNEGQDRINNGADDNATGVTAVLTMADAFSSLPEPPKRTVIFMTFWGEEQGLRGSKYFVEHPLWPLEKIVANINIEMIGRPEENAEGKAWGTGWEHSNLGEQMAAGAARVGMTVFHHRQFSEMLYSRSDNASFVRVGVVAHSFSAGSLHNDYHQPTDEVDKLNLSHMTRVIQGLFAGTMPIADGILTPTASEK
ncbi:MAG: M28 family peptidase [Planctomycetaceae bacterium]